MGGWCALDADACSGRLLHWLLSCHVGQKLVDGQICGRGQEPVPVSGRELSRLCSRHKRVQVGDRCIQDTSRKILAEERVRPADVEEADQHVRWGVGGVSASWLRETGPWIRPLAHRPTGRRTVVRRPHDSAADLGSPSMA